MTDNEHTDGSREPMKNVSHTNPNDPRNVFGELFRRGPSTVADGGERREESEETMREVSHTTPDGPDANRVWDRGKEPVEESEE